MFVYILCILLFGHVELHPLFYGPTCVYLRIAPSYVERAAVVLKWTFHACMSSFALPKVWPRGSTPPTPKTLNPDP